MQLPRRKRPVVRPPLSGLSPSAPVASRDPVPPVARVTPCRRTPHGNRQPPRPIRRTLADLGLCAALDLGDGRTRKGANRCDVPPVMIFSVFGLGSYGVTVTRGVIAAYRVRRTKPLGRTYTPGVCVLSSLPIGGLPCVCALARPAPFVNISAQVAFVEPCGVCPATLQLHKRITNTPTP